MCQNQPAQCELNPQKLMSCVVSTCSVSLCVIGSTGVPHDGNWVLMQNGNCIQAYHCSHRTLCPAAALAPSSGPLNPWCTGPLFPSSTKPKVDQPWRVPPSIMPWILQGLMGAGLRADDTNHTIIQGELTCHLPLSPAAVPAACKVPRNS